MPNINFTSLSLGVTSTLTSVSEGATARYDFDFSNRSEPTPSTFRIFGLERNDLELSVTFYGYRRSADTSEAVKYGAFVPTWTLTKEFSYTDGAFTVDLTTFNPFSTIGGTPKASFQISTVADHTSEGDQRMTFGFGDYRAQAVLNDSSRQPNLIITGQDQNSVPQSSLVTPIEVNEGDVLRVFAVSTNPNGSNVSYSISGTDAADISGLAINGRFFALGGTSYVQTAPFTIVADRKTEGDETLFFESSIGTVSILVKDTSVNSLPSGNVSILGVARQGELLSAANTLVDADGLGPISYLWRADGVVIGSGNTYLLSQAEVGKSISLVANYVDRGGFNESVNSGSTSPVTARDTTLPAISITSNITALTSGQTALLTFTLSEVSTNFTVSDVAVSGGTLSNFSGSGTSYTATFTPTASSTTPGVVSVASGVFTDAAGNANADGADLDNRVTMSVNTTNVQYSLSAGAYAYDEGQTALFSLSASGGLTGGTVSYTVSGITATDLTDGALSGSVVLGPEGRATISIPTALDRLTEGNETLTVSVGGVSASTTIRDTSTTPVSTTGVDTKTYTVASTQASVRSSDGGVTWTVTTPSGVETLAAPDRLRFSDKTIALDFDRGEAGHKTVTMIGAAFGKGFINQYFGTGVSLFDSGQSMAQIAQLVVSTGLIESMVGSSNSAWVRHVYKNVIGVNPDAFTEAVYRTYLDNGTYTKASLLELAAGVTALENQINLVGIRAEGIGYVPFI
jgi:hypothetical protein